MDMMEKPRTSADRRPIWAGIGIISLLAFAVAGCNSSESQTKQAQKGPQAVRIEVTKLDRISIQRQVELAGTMISPDQAKVSSEVAGRIKRLMVELGSEVKIGQPIVELDTSELELSLQQAESQMHQTEAQLGMDGASTEFPPDEEISTIRTAIANRDDARAQAARSGQLIKKGLVSQADFDTTQTRVKVTEAAYQAAIESVRSLKATLRQRRAAVDLAKKKLADAVIKAPIAGSISDRLVQQGEYIRENTQVVTIVQMNPLKLKTAVQEKFASVMRPGLGVQFRVESFPNDLFPGRVAYVSPAVDQATRTFTVEILVDNSDRRLKPGFFAKGNIMIRTDEEVLAVPDKAIVTLAGESSVFVVKGNKVSKIIVNLGTRVGNDLEIISSGNPSISGSELKGDETLAASNLAELAENVTIAIGRGDSSADSGGMRQGGSGRGAGKSGGRGK
jgi:RND family efflux transporter MFP subunit